MTNHFVDIKVGRYCYPGGQLRRQPSRTVVRKKFGDGHPVPTQLVREESTAAAAAGLLRGARRPGRDRGARGAAAGVGGGHAGRGAGHLQDEGQVAQDPRERSCFNFSTNRVHKFFKK